MFRWLLALTLAFGVGFAVVGCSKEPHHSKSKTTTETKSEPTLGGGEKKTTETKTETETKPETKKEQK